MPILAIGKISDPREAEYIVRSGLSDLVCMTRAHIAEPHIVKKVQEGRLTDLRTCIYCNETCFGRSQKNIPISCVYNPRSGRECDWPELEKVAHPKQVLVVGGGPAGLEAARVAAERGHEVHLHERGGQLGGQILSYSKAPFKTEYSKITDWYSRQVEQLGVNVHLNSEMTAERALASGAEAIVVATGSADQKPDIAGAELPHVFTARQVYAGAKLGQRVLIGDWDGRHMGTALADYLTELGHQVEIVSSTFYIGSDVDLLTWRPLYERLVKKGVVMTPLTVLVGAEPGAAIVKSTITSDEQRRAVDSVVLCHRGVSERDLYRQLHGQVANLHAIGDCWAPRQLEQAILEGAKAGRAV